MADIAKLIADIEKGLEGVTQGKWCQFHPKSCPEAKEAPSYEWDTSHEMSAVRDGKRYQIAHFRHADDAAHVDRMNPDNVRALLTHIKEQGERIEELERYLKSLDWTSQLAADGSKS